MKHRELLDLWALSRGTKTRSAGNLRISGSKVIHYFTTIAQIHHGPTGPVVLFVKGKFSSSTSAVQSLVRIAANEAGLRVFCVTDINPRAYEASVAEYRDWVAHCLRAAARQPSAASYWRNWAARTLLELRGYMRAMRSLPLSQAA